jgi:hypothetical protein
MVDPAGLDPGRAAELAADIGKLGLALAQELHGARGVAWAFVRQGRRRPPASEPRPLSLSWLHLARWRIEAKRQSARQNVNRLGLRPSLAASPHL